MLRRSIVSEAIGGLLSHVVSGVVLLCSFRCSSVSAAGISPLAFLTASLSRPWETHSRRFSSPSNCATTPGRSGLRNRLTAPGAFPLSAVRRFARPASAPRRSSWQKRITTGRDLPLLPPVPRQLFLPVWRQSVLPVHLLFLAPLLGRVGPVARDVKLQDDGVVHDPVNRRGGRHGVGEDVLPFREDQV